MAFEFSPRTTVVALNRFPLETNRLGPEREKPLEFLETDSQLMILDPTCSNRKNVTPNCFRSDEVLGVFRRFSKKLEELKSKIADSLDKENDHLSQSSINSLVVFKIEELYGDNVNLIHKLFELK